MAGRVCLTPVRLDAGEEHPLIFLEGRFAIMFRFADGASVCRRHGTKTREMKTAIAKAEVIPLGPVGRVPGATAPTCLQYWPPVLTAQAVAGLVLWTIARPGNKIR